MAKPLHVPAQIPYPHAVRRGWIPVPNAQAVNWPSAQFAPPYFAPGASSVMPYSWQRDPHTLYGSPLEDLEEKGWKPRPLIMMAAYAAVGYLLFRTLT